MTKELKAIAFLLALSTLLGTQAFADQTPASIIADADAQSTDANAPSGNSQEHQKSGKPSFLNTWTKKSGDYMNKAAHHVFKDAFPFTVGFVGGTPIAVARCFKNDTVHGIRDLVGETKNPLLTVPASTLSIPFACVSAPVKGLYFGASDSFRNCDKKPFGKDTFSLGELR